MTFDEWRNGLLTVPKPAHVDCIVWLQNDWRTLAGTFQVTTWQLAHECPVVIVGNDGPRVQELRAPLVEEMYAMLDPAARERAVVLTGCDNTLEQARGFAAKAVEMGWHDALGMTSYAHVVRAERTFARWIPGVRVVWRPAVGTSELGDGEEAEKVRLYAERGDCLALPGPVLSNARDDEVVA